MAKTKIDAIEKTAFDPIDTVSLLDMVLWAEGEEARADVALRSYDGADVGVHNWLRRRAALSRKTRQLLDIVYKRADAVTEMVEDERRLRRAMAEQQQVQQPKPTSAPASKE